MRNISILSRFPSPCGEMVNESLCKEKIMLEYLKVSVPLRGNGQWKNLSYGEIANGQKFPSPCGEMVNESAPDGSLLFNFEGTFPSPCGEMVNERVKAMTPSLEVTEVSVPLRGNGQWKTTLSYRQMATLSLVSVPLRGNGQWKSLQEVQRVLPSIPFPSPCGEMVNERATLQLLTQREFQTANRRNKFYLSIKGGSSSISPDREHLKPLRGKESTHLNERMRLSAISRIASIIVLGSRNKPQEIA